MVWSKAVARALLMVAGASLGGTAPSCTSCTVQVVVAVAVAARWAVRLFAVADVWCSPTDGR